MPLSKKKGKKQAGKNIRELMKSKTFGKGQSKETKRKMAIAAGLKAAGRSRYS